jgi:hypothetical protein
VCAGLDQNQQSAGEGGGGGVEAAMIVPKAAPATTDP